MSDVRFDAEGFFLTAVDQARYQRVLETLLEHGRSVALLSSSGAMVEHYGQRLLQTLRGRQDVLLETYVPGGTESLLGRLNQLLEPLSVDQARAREAAGLGAAPLRVFALHDLEELEGDEAALLARMVQDLPGARLALLILAYRRRRLPPALEESFRRGLRTWSIPVPDEAALARFEAEADGLGLGDEIAPLLTGLRRERMSALLEGANLSGAAPVAPEPPQEEAQAPDVIPRTSAVKPDALPLVRWPFLLALGLLLLCLSWWYGPGERWLTPSGAASSSSPQLSTESVGS